MSNFDKYLLLTSLSFFFACLAVSLVSLYDPAPRSSYIYTPPQVESAQSQPIDSAARQYARTLPTSILHYAQEEPAQKTVTCYLQNEFQRLIETRTAENDAALIARAAMDEDEMQIYRTADDGFFVFVVGPDAIGQTEACEVANGTSLELIR